MIDEGDNQINKNFIMAGLMNCYLISVSQKIKKVKRYEGLCINEDLDNREETVD